MPQLSKVRIVNFSYNDGARLIPDELYDFSKKDDVDALNALINMENGGGKTVLVQLMLQPMVPKVKVAERSIESFFEKGNRNCFILLEWIKDNSTEKLLTGIAMAASESSSADDDGRNGASVKYYTFYSNYSNYSSDFDIVNMPLSKKGENGKFIPAEFDKVRKLAKTSNGVLIYYASDDGPRWQKKLAEYGLIRSEWEMIAKLNIEEGGFAKFFSNFTTSDKLVDGLLIPTIEAKLRNHSRSKDDSSLSTMLIAYATQYAAQQEILREKESFEELVHCLDDLYPMAKDLWEADHNLDLCIRELFGFSDALEARLSACKAKQEQLTSDAEELDRQALKLEHERLSSLYYEAKSAFEEAVNILNQAQEAESKVNEQYSIEHHKQLVMECADYYRRLRQVTGELNALQDQIEAQEKGGENRQKIATLKYSVYTQVSDLQKKYRPEYGALQTNLQETYAKTQRHQKELATNQDE